VWFFLLNFDTDNYCLLKKISLYDQNDCQQFSFITPLFPILANTLKTKVGDVVGCIFDVECRVGGFFTLKQIKTPKFLLVINHVL
jgi:hypothetical protein